MMPLTKNGLDAFVCLSALQKYIRRGDELGAMRFAIELIPVSYTHLTLPTNREV